MTMPKKKKYITMYAFAKKHGVAPSTIWRRVFNGNIKLTRDKLILETTPFKIKPAGRTPRTRIAA